MALFRVCLEFVGLSLLRVYLEFGVSLLRVWLEFVVDLW